jgi:predicted amidohydrolase YtcJ
MQDGVPENLTAAMFEPYLDRSGRRTGDRGPSFVDPDALKRYAVHLDAAGFQVHFHAIGDRAIHEALDAVEAARQANGEGAARHQIAHVQVVHPNDLPRFRALSVAANVQPLWATFEPQMSDLTIPLLGPDRSRRQYPFRSLWRSGAVLAFGSDWPVSSPDPLWQIHTAVNRMPPPGYPYLPSEGTITDPFLPEERLDLPAAIAAATIGSAFVNHLDRRTGTIEEGKLADLVVLDRNLFAEDLVTIGAARVLLTLVEGERVYEDARL